MGSIPLVQAVLPTNLRSQIFDMAHEVLKNLLVFRQHEVVVVLQQPVHPGHAVHVVLPVCKEKGFKMLLVSLNFC